MTLKRVVFWTHLVTALLLGILILVMSVTGTILAFRPQIITFFERSVSHVDNPDQLPRLPLSELAGRLKEANPSFSARLVTVYASPDSAVLFMGRDKRVTFVNPYTAEIIQENSRIRNFMKTTESLHRYFGLQGSLKPVADVLKNVATAGFLFVILTGLIIWFPVKSLFFKRNLSGRARHWNRHTVIGFWGMPFFIAMAVTGLIIANPPAKPGARPPVKSMTAPVDIDAAFQAEIQKNPGWESLTLSLETGANVRPAKRTWRQWVKPIHTGEAGGIIGQFLAFLASLAVTYLVWTGTAMSYVRFFKKKGKKR